MRIGLFSSVIAMAMLSPSLAWAHALGAECRLKNGKVNVSAFFDDDTPAVNAHVEIQDSQQTILAAGNTDARGQWSLAAPPAGRYSVIVDAGMGHRTQIAITVPGAEAAAQHFTREAQEREQTISASTRREFTRFPYLKVGLGLGSIFLFSVAFLVARKKVRSRLPASGEPPPCASAQRH
jgi:hypothetical protein